MQVETFLPCFPGFYGTNFEFDNEDLELDNINEKRAEIGLKPIGYEDVKWSYHDYHIEVSKKAVSYIEGKLNEIGLDCKLAFKELKSPREYNFSTDMIIIDAEFDAEQVRKLFFECSIDAIEQMFDNFRPRPGFSPFSETVKKASMNYWQATDFDNFQDFGWAAKVILESHQDTEFNMDEFIEKSTHEVEVGIDNYSDLVPEKTYSETHEPNGDVVYSFENAKLRQAYNPISGTYFGTEISGFRDALFTFFQEYQNEIEEFIHPEDFFKSIGAVRI